MELVPESKDFYQLTSPIQKVSIRIFPHILLKRNDTSNVFASTVILTTQTEIIKVGLHLFPVMRFKRALPSVDLHLKDEQGKITPLNLPTSFLRRLSDYLEKGKPDLNFTAPQFATYIHNFPSLYGIRTFTRLPFDPASINVGEEILLFSKENNFLHAALYLGEDLFLMHSGPTCLQISSFKEMVKCYNAARAEMLRPQQTERPYIIDINSTNLNFDLTMEKYWHGLPVPDETDFYEGIAPITDVEIEIKPDLKHRLTAKDAGTTFHVTNAAVIFKTSNEILKIGLHLFPIMRVKRQLPVVRLYLVDSLGERKLVPLAQSILQKLSQYLNEGKPYPNFVCYDFINYLNGFSLQQKNIYRTFSIDPQELKSGDSVVVMDANQKAVHAALYIDEGLYLWHAGNQSLKVSTLLDMQNCYKSTDVRLILKDTETS
jgi:hypothetical protein